MGFMTGTPCDFPIRDGNVILVILHLVAVLPCDFPIRDGNIYFRDTVSREYIPCDFPIRDGNFSVFPRMLFFQHPLRLSYKGWKRIHNLSNVFFLWALRLSYKGWKHAPGHRAQAVLLPLRLSYKGWKRLPPVELRRGPPPLRLSYKGWKLVHFFCLVWVYYPCDFPIPLRLSYKGWKLSAPTGDGSAPRAPCDFPIRDGNTPKVNFRPFHAGPCDFPIRDGNPHYRRPRHAGGTALRLSYKGWKRRSLKWVSRSQATLATFL